MCVSGAPSITHRRWCMRLGLLTVRATVTTSANPLLDLGSVEMYVPSSYHTPNHSLHIRSCPIPLFSRAQLRTDQDLHKDAGFPPNVLLNSTKWRERKMMAFSQYGWKRVWKRMSNH